MKVEHDIHSCHIHSGRRIHFQCLPSEVLGPRHCICPNSENFIKDVERLDIQWSHNPDIAQYIFNRLLIKCLKENTQGISSDIDEKLDILFRSLLKGTLSQKKIFTKIQTIIISIRESIKSE